MKTNKVNLDENQKAVINKAFGTLLDQLDDDYAKGLILGIYDWGEYEKDVRLVFDTYLSVLKEMHMEKDREVFHPLAVEQIELFEEKIK